MVSRMGSAAPAHPGKIYRVKHHERERRASIRLAFASLLSES
jgi:hypothetical protein